MEPDGVVVIRAMICRYALRRGLVMLAAIEIMMVRSAIVHGESTERGVRRAYDNYAHNNES